MEPMNHLPFAERLALGQIYEADLLEALNSSTVSIGGQEYSGWTKSTKEEDIEKKIDAWVCGSSAQFKLRQRGSGNDLGIAMIRPYVGDKEFMADYESGNISYDRDMYTTTDLYVWIVDKKITVALGSEVKKILMESLTLLYSEGGFNGWKNTSGSGYQLQLLKDAANGIPKVICYIKPSALTTVII